MRGRAGMHVNSGSSRAGLHRGPPRRAGVGARVERRPRTSRRASGGRRSGTASSSTTTRTRRTGPRLGVLGAAAAGRARLDAARPGTRSPLRPGRLHGGDRAGALRPARRSVRGDGRAVGFPRPPARLAARQEAGAWATLRGRRTIRKRRASRRVSSLRGGGASREDAARGGGAIARPAGVALAGLERWKARHPEAAEAPGDPDDVLVDSMRGRWSTWTRIRVNLRHVPRGGPAPAGSPRPRLQPLVDLVGCRPAARSAPGDARQAPPACSEDILCASLTSVAFGG